MYDLRVWEAVSALNATFPEAEHDESLWPAIKLSYIGMLYEHLRPELAETFFNSVARRVLHEKIRRPWSTFVKYIGKPGYFAYGSTREVTTSQGTAPFEPPIPIVLCKFARVLE